MKIIDIHTHTNFSDCELSPSQLLTEAEKMGLSVFSVSDHNTVEAYTAIPESRHLFSGSILPAVELSTTFKGDVVEILGYGIDVDKMRTLISESYLSFYDKQVKEAKLDTEAMLAVGVVLDDEYVRAMTEKPWTLFDPSNKTNRPYLLAEMKRHPENARFFDSDEEFFNLSEQRFTRNYLFNAQSVLYSDQSTLSPDISTVLDMIKKCSGLSFLAHPFSYSQNVLSSLDTLAECGLDGMECFYGTFTAEQKKFMYNFCEEKGLYKSGGSDYHGRIMRPQNILGHSNVEKIPFSLIEPWFKKVEGSLI